MLTKLPTDPALPDPVLDSVLDSVLGPMLATVRRAHPDVDLVVLPERRPPLHAVASVDLDEAAALAHRGRAAVAGLVEAAEVEPAGIVSLWWRLGPDGSHRHVTRATLVDLAGAAASMQVLDRVRGHLADSGWRVRALLEPRPRLSGEEGPLTVRVEGYPTAVEVEVVTAPLVLDGATLAALEDLDRGGRPR